MILEVFAIYDKAIGAFGQPQFMRSSGEAMRAFMDVMVREENLRKHAEDYFFARLGTYDDATGTFINCSNGYQKMMDGLDALTVENGVS